MSPPELVRNLNHSDAEMDSFRGRPILDQLEFRQSRIELELSDAGFPLERLQAVVGRGGLMRPLASGTYRVNEPMLQDLRSTRYGEHASNLGAYLAQAIAGRRELKPSSSIPSVWMSSVSRRESPARRWWVASASRMP